VDAGKASGEDNSGDELDQLADAMGRLSCSSGTDGEADESAGDGSDGDKSDGEDRGSEGDDREYVLVGDGKAGAQDSDGHDSGIDGEGEAGSWEDAAKEVYETGQTPAASEPREVDAPMVGSEKETEASVVCARANGEAFLLIVRLACKSTAWCSSLLQPFLVYVPALPTHRHAAPAIALFNSARAVTTCSLLTGCACVSAERRRRDMGGRVQWR
jgi:hypothetical protein